MENNKINEILKDLLVLLNESLDNVEHAERTGDNFSAFWHDGQKEAYQKAINIVEKQIGCELVLK